MDVEIDSVAADSLGARRVGEIAFDLARRFVDGAVTVEDSAIRASGAHRQACIR